MFAIRAHRLAGGDTVDGQAFEHQRWTLVDELTPALEAAARPEPNQSQPRLAVIEIVDEDDPLLGGLPIVGQDALIPADGADEDGEELDIEHASAAALRKLAKMLGIPRSQGRLDLITAIREKQSALSAETKDAEAKAAEANDSESNQ